MGGGFDVFCGLPIYFDLQDRGHNVHLASLSFADIDDYNDHLTDSMVAARPATPALTGYHPERNLARWLSENTDTEPIVWCIKPTGVQTVLRDLRILHSKLAFDTIILVDGGVDSITRGDEELIGTVMEDYVTLVAAAMLEDIPTKILACIGFGIEGDVSHESALENIAAITADGGFLGNGSLVAQSRSYELYEQAVTFAHNQPGQQPSVINASIVSSVRGHFGDYHATERTKGSKLWISPLMSLYWFFDLHTVAKQNLFLEPLRETITDQDVAAVIYDARDSLILRPAKPIPLS
jgi:hypothetical protein